MVVKKTTISYKLTLNVICIVCRMLIYILCKGVYNITLLVRLDNSQLGVK